MTTVIKFDEEDDEDHLIKYSSIFNPTWYHNFQ